MLWHQTCLHNLQLSVSLDPSLAFQQRISSGCRIYIYIWNFVGSEDVHKQLLCAFVLARSDYCNPLFLSKQNNAVRHIFRASTSAHVTPMFPCFHWLLIEDRIEYKLSFLCSLIKSHLPFRPSLPAHYFPAAPLFCRHRRVQHTTPGSAKKVRWSALILLPGSLNVCPSCCLCHRENSNSNSKTLFYKDCSLGSFKNLSNN